MKIYCFAWGTIRKKGRLCRKLAAGRMRSCLVEFLDDGCREIVSQRALRKCK